MVVHNPLGYKIGCTIFGNTGVGKTSLCQRFIKDEFVETSAITVGINYFTKEQTVDGVPILLSIIDTAGIESSLSMASLYNRGRQAFILGVYDITDHKSFADLDTWLSYFPQPSEVLLFLIGTKCDLSKEREVSHVEAERFAEEHNCILIETSAKTGLNVKEVFEKGCRHLLKEIESGDIDLNNKNQTQPGIKLLSQSTGPWYDTKGACF